MEQKLNFYDILFQGQKLVQLKKTFAPLSEDKWDCRVGIFGDLESGGEADHKLLSGILKACLLQENEWRIFPKGTVYSSVFSLEHLKYILLFGVKESDLDISLNIPFYRPYRFNEKIWIKSHSLSTLSKQQQYKMELWQNALKPVFVR